MNRTLVVKIGGSALDLEFEQEGSRILAPIVDSLVKLAEEYPVVVMPGGGPAWDVRKAWDRKYLASSRNPAAFREMAEDTLRHNAIQLQVLIGEKSRLMEPDDWARLMPNPPVGTVYLGWRAPRAVVHSREDEWFSDVHTVGMAEFLFQSLGGESCYFIKDAPGIFRWDPRLDVDEVDRLVEVRQALGDGHRSTELESLRALREVLASGSSNERFDELALENAIQGRPGFFTVGADGEEGHLIEAAALRYWRDHCPRLKRVVVVDVRQPGKVESILRGETRASAFVK